MVYIFDIARTLSFLVVRRKLRNWLVSSTNVAGTTRQEIRRRSCQSCLALARLHVNEARNKDSQECPARRQSSFIPSLAPCVRLVRPSAMTPTSFLSTSIAIPAIPTQTPSPITTSPLILILRILVPYQPSNNRRSQRPHPRFNQHVAYQPSKPNKVGSIARRGKAAGGFGPDDVQTVPRPKSRHAQRAGCPGSAHLGGAHSSLRCQRTIRDAKPLRFV